MKRDYNGRDNPKILIDSFDAAKKTFYLGKDAGGIGGAERGSSQSDGIDP